MRFSSSVVLSWLLGAALVVSPVLGALETSINAKGQVRDNPCGSVATPEIIAEASEKLAKNRLTRRQTPGQTYTFDVYWHVIASNMTIAGGWVPQSQIDAQIKMINDGYEGTGISWNLVNVSRTLSRYWHETVDDGLVQTMYMHALHRIGDNRALNVYSVGFYGLGLNGYATFPSDYARYPIYDGVVLLYETVPGGTSQVRQGGTLLHEAGHWLGLYHTFQGGCTGVGDRVADTPPSAEPSFGCPIGLDSCLGDSLPDPIHNYMDYTDESCRTEFTPGQIELMHETIETFRV